MKDEQKKVETKKVETPAPKAVDAKPTASDIAKAEALAPPADLRSVVSKEEQAPVSKKAASSGKNTWAQLWQNASGKKGDPNEKDSKGSPVLEKYYRNWVNAD